MLREKARLLQNLSVLLDALVVIGSFVLAYFLKASLPGALGTVFDPVHSLWVPLVGTPVWLMALYAMGMYQSQRTSAALETVFRIAGAALITGLVLSAIVLGLKIGVGVSRGHLAMWAIITVSGLTIEKLLVRSLLWQARRKGHNLRFVMLVGAPSQLQRLYELIERHQEWGYRLVGRVKWSDEGPEEAEHEAARLPILGSLDELGRVLESNSIDEVFLPLLPERWSEAERVLAACEEVGVNVRIQPNTFGAVLAKTYIDHLADQPMLTFTTTPTHPGALLIKQIFDYAAAAVLIVLLAPVLITAAIAVRLSGPGPILFRQERCGLNGRRFTLLKFRSMVVDAESKREELEDRNEASGPVFKIRNDPRVTAVGRFLRRTSIDELPQLFNVLRGEMSLVGPRPPIPGEVDQYERWQRRRLSMKPGITCLWQVTGRNNVGFDDWMRLDLHYIDNWSLLLDLRILMKTVGVVLSRRGAY